MQARAGSAESTGRIASAPLRVPAVGEHAPDRSFGPITRTDIVRYAGASGDFNPIHHDEPYAIAAGFPTVFSIGMFQAGLLGTYVTDWFDPETLRRFAVRFREQVWPGDVLTCSGVVTGVSERQGGSRVDVELRCVRQTGGVAISGEASFFVAAAPSALGERAFAQ